MYEDITLHLTSHCTSFLSYTGIAKSGKVGIGGGVGWGWEWEVMCCSIASIPDPSSKGGRELCFSINNVVPLLPWRRG
jgi:hypothetical protein